MGFIPIEFGRKIRNLCLLVQINGSQPPSGADVGGDSRRQLALQHKHFARVEANDVNFTRIVSRHFASPFANDDAQSVSLQ